MSSPHSQSVTTHKHAFCGDTEQCNQFAQLSAPRYFEFGAAKVGDLFFFSSNELISVFFIC